MIWVHILMIRMSKWLQLVRHYLNLITTQIMAIHISLFPISNFKLNIHRKQTRFLCSIYIRDSNLVKKWNTKLDRTWIHSENITEISNIKWCIWYRYWSIISWTKVPRQFTRFQWITTHLSLLLPLMLLPHPPCINITIFLLQILLIITIL